LSNIAEFAEIPEYSVTDNMTLEDVNNLVTEIYTRNYKAVNGTTPPLHSADPITLTLKSISELYYMVLQVAEKRNYRRHPSRQIAECTVYGNFCICYRIVEVCY
jgi:hypothetical protein